MYSFPNPQENPTKIHNITDYLAIRNNITRINEEFSTSDQKQYVLKRIDQAADATTGWSTSSGF